MEDTRVRIVIYRGIHMVKSERLYVENKWESVQRLFEMLEEVE